MKQDTRSSSHAAPVWRQRTIGAVGSLAVVAVFSAAVFVLHRELRDYSLRDIEQRLSLLSWGQLAAALALTATSYTLLTGYDWLALHYIDRSLSYSRIALASFVSYVSSYNFGAILGGSTMRYRLYSTFGLSAVEVVKIIAICTLTFVLGFCTLAGAVFTFDPLPLPELIEVRLPFTTVQPIGIVLLALVGAYLCLSVLRLKPFAVRGWEFSLPSVGFTLMQMLVATADLMAAAAVLYTLLPAEITVSYPMFLGIFLTAQVAGIMSHVPGGLGVVEAILLHTLAPHDPASVMGSLVVYRLTYYLLPLVLATGLLAGHEAFLRWETVTRYAGVFGRWARRDRSARVGMHHVCQRHRAIGLWCFAPYGVALALAVGFRAAAGCRNFALFRQRRRDGAVVAVRAGCSRAGRCVSPFRWATGGGIVVSLLRRIQRRRGVDLDADVVGATAVAPLFRS